MENKAEELKRSGIEAFNKSDFQSAVEHFSNAILQDSTDADLFNNRAVSYRKLNLLNDALKDTSESISLAPHEPLYYSTRASILTEMGKQLEALENIDYAIHLDPSLEYLENKIVILRKLNKYRDALSTIESIEKEGHASSSILIYKGILLVDTRKLKEAEQVFESLLSSDQSQLASKYLTIIKGSLLLPKI